VLPQALKDGRINWYEAGDKVSEVSLLLLPYVRNRRLLWAALDSEISALDDVTTLLVKFRAAKKPSVCATRVDTLATSEE
jgi:hypothetical protein